MSLTVLASAALLMNAAVSAADVSAPDAMPPSASTAVVLTVSLEAADSLVLPEFVPTVIGTPTQVLPLEQMSQSAEQVSEEGPEEGPEEGIVVSGERSPAQDPMQSVNQASYDAVQAVDGAVIAPVAMQYEKAIPRPIRTGLRNFLVNLTEPIVALNFILQLKPGKAAETFSRFAINSTIGIAGVLDVADDKPFNLPYRRNGFANTFGYYGIGNGPYMFLPLVGATTLRDAVGLGLDRFLMPLAVGGPLRHPAYVYGGFIVRSLNDRVENDVLFKEIDQETNPYASYRQYYLKTRQAEIDALKGKAVSQEQDSNPAPEVVLIQPTLTPAPPTPAPSTPALPSVEFISQPVIQPLPVGD